MIDRRTLLMAALGLQLEHRGALAEEIEHRSMCQWCGELFEPDQHRRGPPILYCPGKECGGEARRALKRAKYAEQKDELKVRRVLGEAA